MSSPSPKIAIIGGGLGGLSTLLSLLKNDFTNVTCYERDQHFNDRMNGYGLTLSYNPKGPLAKLGILEKVARSDCKSREHYVFTSTGTLLGYFGNTYRSWSHFKTGQRGNLRVPRQLLRKIIIDSIQIECTRLGVNVEDVLVWGKDLNCLKISEGGLVEVLFKDTTREQGVFLVIGLSKLNHPLLFESGFYTVDGSARLFLMPFKEGETMWQLSFRCENWEEAERIKRSGVEGILNFVKGIVNTWHSPIPELISDTEIKTIWGTGLVDRNPSPINVKGVKGRVVVIGDGMHAMSPFKGQGANQALTDGPALVEKLKGCKNIHAALLNFEREMIDRTKIKVKDSRKAAGFLHSEKVLSEDEVFAGVKSADVPRLLEELRKRNIGAETDDLEGAIKQVMNELGVVCEGFEEGFVKPKLNEEDMLITQKMALEGDMPGIRRMSILNPMLLHGKDGEGRSLIRLACEGEGEQVSEVMVKWLVEEARVELSEDVLEALEKKNEALRAWLAERL
ncbi:hypothetical protein TL16_g02465 [Triparma laevis f. inornata]|uniref:FAD-binding domain-containing protein n=2 Tax=Triparma laevis TaxID=1534972 RepID=A0A9W7BYL1_9STRA|nr:hypothetical protein TL16_g02465 [Triparma laevis f. inornata]GMH98922.1 hypothetical protein TrLO_g14220 [Triparma laevis f. longispina]